MSTGRIIALIGGGLALTLAAVLAIAVFSGANPFGKIARLGDERREATIRRELLGAGYATYPAIAEHFPAEFDAMVTELAQAQADGADAATIGQRASGLLADIRRRHAAGLATAPAGPLRAIAELSLPLHTRVREAEGRETCNAFAIGGGAVLTRRSRTYTADIDAIGARLFAAMAAGEAADGTTPDTASDADWAVLSERALAAGLAQEALDDIAAQDPSRGDLCPTVVAMLEAILAMDGPVQERLLRGFAYAMAAN